MSDIIAFYFHLIAACLYIGSAFFIGTVMIPGLRRSLEHGPRMAFLGAIAKPAKIFTWSSLVILIVTGLYRMRAFMGTELMRTGYGKILEKKVGLVLIALILSIIHDFVLGPKMKALPPGDPRVKKLRTVTIVFAQIQLVLLLLIALQAVRMRFYSW